MNEIELLEAQLATERRHVLEVAAWCATVAARGFSGSISDDFTDSCYRYLMFSMRKEEARAAAHLELAAARAPEPTVRAASEHLRAALASASEAAARVRAVFAIDPGDAAAASRDAPAASQLDELATFAERTAGLIESRVALAALTAPHYTLGERRRTAHVDADSILEERRLHTAAARHGTSVIR